MEYTPEEVRGVKKFLASLDLDRWGMGVDFSRTHLNGLYEIIAEDDELANLHLALMRNPNTPPHVVEYLVDKHLRTDSKFTEDNVVYHLISNKNAPVTVLVKVLEYAPQAAVFYAGQLASHSNFPPERVPEIAQYITSAYDLEYVLRKPGMTGEIVRKIWQRSKKTRGIAIQIARCSATPPDVLSDIVAQKYEHRNNDTVELRKALAGNENTPPEMLAKLAFDRVLEVRCKALANPSTPQETLRRAYQFSQKHDYPATIQKALAANPSCPDDILIALAMSDIRSVAEAAAEALRKRGEAA